MALLPRSSPSLRYIACGQAGVPVTVEQAVVLVKSNECQGKINRRGQLVHIRQIPPAAPQWEICWRTGRSGVLPWWADSISSRGPVATL